MFRRLLWLTIGVSLGFGISLRVTRAVKHTIDRYRPQQVTAGLAGAARSLGTNLRAAVAEGRQAMHEQEAALRGRLEARLARPGE